MNALWTSEEAVAATTGRATREWSATGVSIDSREIAPGDLFVALTAARDGHDFVSDALSKGAAAALVSRVPDGVTEDTPLLIVPDVQAGLEALASAARSRCKGRIIAITGSAGKTSTKKMLADALNGQGMVHAAARSFNNHWGVPLTLARMPADTDFAVVEIGMNAPGEIAPLARLTRPHVAIVTLVAAAHLEAFGSLDGIAREKASIFDGLEPGGTAILNADLDTTPILEERASHHAAHTLRFGETADAEWRLVAARSSGSGTEMALECPLGRFDLRLGTAGRHFAVNALAVLAAVWASGGDVAASIERLAGWVPPGGRGESRRILLPSGGEAILIDDAFNANPASVSAALELLATQVPGSGGRRVAILGDMLELGPGEALLHAEIADHGAMAGVAVVHCVGSRMRNLWNALPEMRRGEWAETAEEMRDRLSDLARTGDVILVKGSKGSRVSLLVSAFMKAGATPAEV